jgi:hypothetical protein
MQPQPPRNHDGAINCCWVSASSLTEQITETHQCIHVYQTKIKTNSPSLSHYPSWRQSWVFQKLHSLSLHTTESSSGTATISFVINFKYHSEPSIPITASTQYNTLGKPHIVNTLTKHSVLQLQWVINWSHGDINSNLSLTIYYYP